MSTRRFLMSTSRLSSTFLKSQLFSSVSKLQSDNKTFLGNESLGFRYLSNYSKTQRSISDTRNFSLNNSIQSGAPLPSQPPTTKSLLSWILGIVVTVVLPMVTNKWGPLLQFKNDVDNAVNIVEEIVDIVEEVAEVVDKVAADVSVDLPEGGKLKKAVDLVEDVAEKTAKDAHTVGDAIDKFQEVEEKVKNIVETLGGEAMSIPKNLKDGNESNQQ